MRQYGRIGAALAALSLAGAVGAAPGAAQDSSAASGRPRANLSVTVDVEATKAVLAALQNPALTTADALRVAALPGNQGLIRKARNYGRPASNELFAKALIAAAQGNDAEPDPARFRFGQVRSHIEQIRATLDNLEDPKSNLLDQVKGRIAEFTPPDLGGHVVGHLIVGGTSGGFAFGDPEFFLNLDRFPSAPLAATVMQHELFHAIQGIAKQARPLSPKAQACTAAVPHSKELVPLFASLEMEGSASLVGDVAAMPAGTDAGSDEARQRTLRNIGLVDRSVTLLELSVHGLNTGAEVPYDDVYALGFYGDEVLYALGYVMARAIVAEEGKGAIAELTGQPGALFVQRYRKLRGYGKSEAVPALGAETLRSADRLAACLA